MKCPFRTVVRYEYVDFGDNKVTVDTVTTEYVDCYEKECQCYKWSFDEGYHCLQVKALGEMYDDR